MSELNILQIINEDPKLSPFPEIYFQIKEAIGNPASGFESASQNFVKPNRLFLEKLKLTRFFLAVYLKEKEAEVLRAKPSSLAFLNAMHSLN